MSYADKYLVTMYMVCQQYVLV